MQAHKRMKLHWFSSACRNLELLVLILIEILHFKMWRELLGHPVCREWFLAKRMKHREGAWRERCLVVCLGKTSIGGSSTFEFPNADGHLYSHAGGCYRVTFLFFKHHSLLKCINVMHMLCSSRDRHSSKSCGPGSKSGKHLSAPHEARHPTSFPAWTASAESGVSP